ncbi:unnamed protein product [Acanthoscelides obtectus]|uniref:Uncharacterized protein n=1 Tax=Acanthoscelides obtectus TaxID=200917 RepID=A0A9P0KK64_ACAOB|nr:unnamed protein product [Acanthoscelides obtectus]CAK1642716.1 hypothetical protein AOBTE_LOCUS13179 [Acanthoscelides obtectus]
MGVSTAIITPHEGPLNM